MILTKIIANISHFNKNIYSEILSGIKNRGSLIEIREYLFCYFYLIIYRIEK